jgi:pimeloyl-ACP methyl ester carboxylesterase
MNLVRNEEGQQIMNNSINLTYSNNSSNSHSAFKSPSGEAAFMTAYDANIRRWPVPYDEIDIPGRYGCTHLVASGPQDAPALVLLHGYLASLTMWSANVADLSRDYRVYAIDVIGQPGKSIPAQPSLSREDLLAWLTEVLDALKITRATLVGQSYGSWLALNYAIHVPDRVNKLVLLSPAACFLPLNRQHTLRGLAMLLFPSRLTVRSFKLWETYRGSLGSPEKLAFFNAKMEQMYLGLRFFNFHATKQTPPGVFTDEELRGVRVPTLLLIGQQEVIYDPAASLERARRLIPCVEAGLIADASHDMSYFQAGAVDARVLEFMKRH